MILSNFVKRVLGMSIVVEARRAGPLTPANSVDEAIARMQSISDHLPQTDGVAYFNRMYLK